MHIDSDPSDRPFRGWQKNARDYEFSRLLCRARYYPGTPRGVTRMWFNMYGATPGSVEGHKTRKDRLAKNPRSGYQAMFRSGSHQSATRGWLKPTWMTDSLVRKANIIYGEKDDAGAALELYGRAQSLQPLSSTADAASQLCLRVGRSGATSEQQRQEKLDLALALARDSIELVNVQYQRPEKRAQVRTKCLLQLAIVHLARKETDDAEETWRELDEKLLEASGGEHSTEHAQ